MGFFLAIGIFCSFLLYPLHSQELRWTGKVQSFDKLEVFRVFALPGNAGHEEFVGTEVEDSSWPLFYAPADWKEGPFPGHDGKVVYRLKLFFDKLPEIAPGIFLGNAIDHDWTYFNGRLIGHNGILGDSPTQNAFDVYRLYEIPPDLVSQGENVLTVVVENYRSAGGMLRGPFLFGPMTELVERIHFEDRVVVGLLSIYTLVGLTFLLLCLRNPREIVNWVFTGFLLLFTVYFLSRSRMRFELSLDFMFWKRLELITISVAPALFLLFLLTFFKMKFRFFHWIFLGASAISVLLYIFLPENLQWTLILTNWTQPSWLYLFIIVVYILVKNFHTHEDGKPLFFSILSVLLALLYDVLVSRHVFGPSNVNYVGQYAFALFILALSWIQGARFGRMYLTLETRVEERTHALAQSLEELKTAQNQLIQSEKQASLGNLVAGVAHEVNTPLGICITAVSRLKSDQSKLLESLKTNTLTQKGLAEFANDSLESADIINLNLNRAADIVRSFKEIAVNQGSEIQTRFCLDEYLRTIFTSLKHELKLRPYEIEIGMNNFILNSYPGAFSHIVTNLVMNTLIHGYEPKDAVKISLHASRNGSEVTFTYTDHGKGIPADALPRIFDPFFTTRRGIGGSGLGLSISYNLVRELLKGDIRCTSEPGIYTSFTIVFEG